MQRTELLVDDGVRTSIGGLEVESFVFGSVAAAECFRWLLKNRQNYAIYGDNWTGYLNDPLGLQLAYDLRESAEALKDGDCRSIVYRGTTGPDQFLGNRF